VGSGAFWVWAKVLAAASSAFSASPRPSVRVVGQRFWLFYYGFPRKRWGGVCGQLPDNDRKLERNWKFGKIAISAAIPEISAR